MISEKIMNILCATDENYIVPMAVMMTSVIANNDGSIRFFIVDGGITDEGRERILSLRTDDVDISFIDAPSMETLKRYDLPDESYHSIAMYYRLFASELLPIDVERVLYLDCDIVVRGDLSELYDTDFNNNLVIGCRDIHEKECCERLVLDHYINSGVLMIDLKGWRDEDILPKFMEYVRNEAQSMKWHDQDIINCVLKGRIGITDQSWNAQVCTFTDSEEQNIIAPEGRIIHYITSKKPWRIGAFHPFFDCYQHYLSLSPYSEIRFKKHDYLINSVMRRRTVKKMVKIIMPDRSLRKRVFLKVYDSFVNVFLM